MDAKLRGLERAASLGDRTSQERLSRERDRTDMPYTVYVLKEAEWQYNDQWYSTYDPDVVHAFRTKERAEQEIIKRFRDFLLDPPFIEGRDWVDLMGVPSLQHFLATYYEEDAVNRVALLRSLGFTVRQISELEASEDDYTSYTTYRLQGCGHYICSCIPPKEVSHELAQQLLDTFRTGMYQIVETTLE